MWFFEQLSPGNLAYNFQATVRLRGEVDPDVLRAALNEIVRRHEILRTGFVAIEGVGTQRPVTEVAAPLRVLEISDAAPREVYGYDLILLRPDLHVAWRGNRLPDDPAKHAAIVTGH